MKTLLVCFLMLLLACNQVDDVVVDASTKGSSLLPTMLINLHEKPRLSGNKKSLVILNQSYGRPTLAVTIEDYDLGYLFCEKMITLEKDSHNYQERCRFFKDKSSPYKELSQFQNLSSLSEGELKDYGDVSTLYISVLEDGRYQEYSIEYCENIDSIHNLIKPVTAFTTLFEFPACKL